MSTDIITSKYTSDQARRFTDEIKRDGSALWQKVAEAYDGQIWIAMGYKSGNEGWQQYIANEFPDGLLIPPKERQNDAIQHYLQQGMSTRAIAQVTDLSQKTVDRRARELRDGRPGESFDSPGNVQGLDGKSYVASRPGNFSDPNTGVVDAEIIDEAERQQPNSSSPRSVSNGTGRREVRNVHGSHFGLEEFDEEPGRDELQVSEEAIQKTIGAFNGSGSADAQQIRKTAMYMVSQFRSGLIPAEAWDKTDLTNVADDAIDTVSVLLSLLLAMDEPNYSNGVSREAIEDSKVRGQLSTVTQKVEALSGGINSGAPAAGSAGFSDLITGETGL